MRVAIVGILERQAKLAGEFPRLQIMYSNSKRKGDGLKNIDAINKCDRILVTTKFVSHKTTENLDRSKVTWINGGITRIREALERLNDLAPMVEEPASAPTLHFRAQTEEPPTAPVPPKPIGTTMTKPSKPKQYDFTPLYSVPVGEMIGFPKPTGLSKELWRARVSAIVNYAKKKHGLITETEHRGDETHILVTAKVNPSTVLTTKKPRKKPPAKKTEVMGTEHAMREAPSEQAMATASALWKEAYLEHVSATKTVNHPDESAKYASSLADKFLEWYRKHQE